ncbi:MAG TPA: LPS export ABC transporter periplasmic protein LptC [Sphingomonadaceae bacterium]|nr:LPS export ABC transporter periplasmic protein LptC [Sphingomonadaceae bacterium]
MTADADRLRNKRQQFAAPGGAHDRLVKRLSRWLPAGIGVIAALMIFVPFTPRNELSFLLDRNKVAIAENRLRLENAMYRGQDSQGRPFSITAGEAVQRSAREPVVEMHDLEARILLKEGPALLAARDGHYDIHDEVVAIDGLVRFTAADGYRMTARDVSIRLEENTLIGDGKVEGAIPAGTFSADRIVADLEERTITLDGNARLRMVPGELRIP